MTGLNGAPLYQTPLNLSDNLTIGQHKQTNIGDESIHNHNLTDLKNKALTQTKVLGIGHKIGGDHKHPRVEELEETYLDHQDCVEFGQSFVALFLRRED